VSIRDLLSDFDAQLRELENQAVQLEEQIPYLVAEIEGIKDMESKRYDIYNNYSKYLCLERRWNRK
jgi:hypothetical protein